MSAPAPEKHTGRTAVEIAAAARVVQLAIRARLLRDVTALWPALDKTRLDETFPGWIRSMSLLVRSYHGQSAQAAASAYRAAREEATGESTPSSVIRLAPVPSAEWLNKAFGYSGPGMLQRDTVKPNTALSTTLGASARIVLDGGRRTIIDTTAWDKAAVGYYRLTDGDPCAFCALMCMRGPIYKSSGTGGENANKKFTGDGRAKFHNDCGCSVNPWFGGDFKLSPVAREADRVYKDDTELPTVKDFRRAWDKRSRG